MVKVLVSGENCHHETLHFQLLCRYNAFPGVLEVNTPTDFPHFLIRPSYRKNVAMVIDGYYDVTAATD